MKKLNINKEKVLENIKKNKIMLAIFAALWVVLLVITLNGYSSSLGMKSSGNDCLAYNVFDVDENTTITEVATLEHNEKSVSIMFATFARKNKGNVYIKVEGVNTNKVYLDTSLKTGDVLDNAFMSFSLNEEVDCTKDRKIKITLSSDSANEQCAGVYYTEKALENSEFKVNGEEIDGDLKVRFLRQDDVLSRFNNKVVTWTIIGLSIIILLIVFSNKSEHIFATMTLIFGLIFMVIITPMSPPDEQKHYEYSYQLSSYMMGQGKDHMKIEREYQNYTHFAGHMNVSDTYSAFEEEINKDYEHNDKYEIITDDNDILEATYYLCYIPQAIAITICRLFSLNFYKLFYAGRLFNLLFYVLCVYFAIKKTPVHKTLFGIIATMPIFVQQAASYSYDACLNGCMLLIASFLFDWLNKEGTISNKEIVALFLIILYSIPLKVVYSLFIFCFAFVPYERFGTKKRKYIALLVIFVPVVIQLFQFFVPYLAKVIKNIKEVVAYNYEKNLIAMSADELLSQAAKEPYYVGYMVQNPGEVIMLYLRTIRLCIKVWFYEALGRSLSGVSLVLPLKLVHVMSYISIAAMLIKEKYITPIKVRISFVVIAGAIGIFAMTGMLLTWTAIGSDIVQGMQGRYFCPLLFFVMTVINNPKIYLPKSTNKYIICAQVLMMFETIIYVLSYTFVN